MDDDDFGDDDVLQSIPDNTLQQLEDSACSSTQLARSNAVAAVPTRPQIRTYGTTGLSRATHPAQSAWRPPQPRKQPQIQTAPPASAPAPPSSDYGFGEEDVIDLDEPSMVIQSTSALPDRGRPAAFSNPPSARHGSKPPLDPETEAAFAAADAELGAQQPAQWAQQPRPQHSAPSYAGADISKLQARIAELEAKQSHLQFSEQEARNIAQQKAGEIAIVRANHDKAFKEYERRIAVLQKTHAEESARQKAELESGRKEREKMETSNRFLQHDLAQESEKAKGLRGTGKTRSSVQNNTDVRLTPRKHKRGDANGVLGDGFEDEEVAMLVSPSRSKGKERSGEQTPKAGNKRKRQAMDSPTAVRALSLKGPPPPLRQESTEQSVVETQRPILVHDDRYDFMQKLLHHRPHEGAERSMETLTKLTFASNTSRTMASMLLDELYAPAPQSTQPESLVLKLCHALLALWSQCLQERLHSTIPLLLDLLNFVTAFERASTLVELTSAAVPICIKTIDLIALPTAKASRYAAYASSEEYKKVLSDVGPHIDVDEVMDFLQRMCDASSLQPDKGAEFWRSIEFTFTLQMLHKAQPINQILTALRMVSTSALDSTFGPICSTHASLIDLDVDTAQKQAKQEKDMVNRLTSMLFETPEVPKDEPPYTGEEIQELRVAILDVLKTLCMTDRGSLVLAQHWSAIGRLVKFLEAQVNRLYSTQPSLGLECLDLNDDHPTEADAQPSPNVHDLIIQTVNTTVRLLYHLLHENQPPVDLQQKLRAVRGGYHKFLLSFTRIAFSDQLVFEEGIDNEVVEAAHAILDEVLSPEEGEAVMRAVETPRGTRGSAVEMEDEPG